LQTVGITVFGFRDKKFSSAQVRDVETTDLQPLASEVNLTWWRNGAKTNRNLQDMNSRVSQKWSWREHVEKEGFDA
jgi:hypothetical protein